MPFVDREHGVDGIVLYEHRKKCFLVGADQVSRIDGRTSDATVIRRKNLGVGEVQLGVSEFRFGGREVGGRGACSVWRSMLKPYGRGGDEGDYGGVG